jgi:hypothetical protein
MTYDREFSFTIMENDHQNFQNMKKHVDDRDIIDVEECKEENNI